MLSFPDINDYLVSKGIRLSESSIVGLAQYKLGEQNVAFVSKTANPVRLSLRCNKDLGKLLVEKYESVMPGHKLDPDKWITVVASGQLSDDEIYELVDHAVMVAKNNQS